MWQDMYMYMCRVCMYVSKVKDSAGEAPAGRSKRKDGETRDDGRRDEEDGGEGRDSAAVDGGDNDGEGEGTTTRTEGSFLAAARHAFSERGIQNNRAEGRGDHTRSAGGVPLRGHKGSSKGSEQDAAQATCTLAACARRVALSPPLSLLERE